LMAIGSRAARRYAQYRVQALGAEAVPLREAPTWCMLNGPMVDLSSTQIRALGDWDVSKT
jgi:nicotinate-nucleotide adenylyltransferase